jgi:hypothetical protein
LLIERNAVVRASSARSVAISFSFLSIMRRGFYAGESLHPQMTQTYAD